MNRRSLFSILFAPLVARFFPKKTASIRCWARAIAAVRDDPRIPLYFRLKLYDDNLSGCLCNNCMAQRGLRIVTPEVEATFEKQHREWWRRWEKRDDGRHYPIAGSTINIPLPYKFVPRDNT